ncbi:bifunctional phosphoribosyl-AMP cyclohydrolase/phosphoribosyl-ATP diphosphatase HisIE [Sporosarcina sp. PTS2304]|uniref:bifunctional phosphoribosyl-AMP cyclohydrolase/phosphoribosyl-ATP diphosphatase HisIE n=1 Tax=Sporosarcina sp. PTS2304 TaxID=2283194 RepID=UPI000E0D1278|nr:bifunctional phosphoribosyl-AMP cyclohydrolase/phosphoribosyl-ATP diphosphatase HisIE [Sporosarcina sp. PTS2304]AXH99571.1 bifunctional phosphoribosyl-AMP cyclohydrolase/phosphoribosyl-ATP diphosphatase HisIE [Sporosarcina sp. PTS2304]
MTLDINTLKFDDKGLLPAIVQDDRTGEVLMLAYMNKESIEKTIETNETWFYSRSRQELWNKGATSGNRQQVKRISLDCDQDTLLIQVTPQGPACHTGEKTCFFKTVTETEESLREVVYEVIDEIADRKANPLEGSYTTYLFNEGIDKVLKKVGEETTEVVIGAKNADKEEVSNEIADLIYHTLVLMNILDVDLTDVQSVLRERRPKKEVLRNE